MSTLDVTRSLVSNTNPTETQFDTMRNDLLDFFNNDTLDAANITTGGMLYSSLNMDLADDITMKWTGDDATLSYVSAADYFKIQNTENDLQFGLKSGSTYTSYMTLDSSTGLLTVSGVVNFNTSVGSQGVNLMWLLSRYRKPRLVYSDGDIVTMEANGPDGNTYIMGRDRLWQLYDTTCSLAVDANGETTGDTGTAVSGRLAAEARVANRWYYIYAVEVQYGTQNSGAYCILVATVTSPLAANITTLNTAFGTGKWVYCGVVRNGYNDGTTTNVIIPFRVEENGFTMITQGTTTPEGMGMVLASNTNGASNLEYTVDITNNDADSIPPVATRMLISGYRSAYGFEFHYTEVSSSEIHALTSNGYHPTDSPTLTGVVQLEVPVLAGYKIIVIIGHTETDKRICLAGYMDHYV